MCFSSKKTNLLKLPHIKLNKNEFSLIPQKLQMITEKNNFHTLWENLSAQKRHGIFSLRLLVVSSQYFAEKIHTDKNLSLL